MQQIFTANGPAIVAEHRGGLLDVSAEQLGTIVQPTLLVAGKDSPPAFAEVTNLMAAAMPSARVEWVDGGHLINPAHPAVLAFVDEVLARRAPRWRLDCLGRTAASAQLDSLHSARGRVSESGRPGLRQMTST